MSMHNLPLSIMSAAMDFFFEFEIAVVYEPSVFEPLCLGDAVAQWVKRCPTE